MRRALTLAFGLGTLVGPLRAQKPAPVLVIGLKHEYRTNPLGTDALRPRLSWRLESNERDVMQAAYEIQVATDDARLAAGGKALLWDSGRLASNASLFRPYDGPALQSRSRYFWRVRIWDASGRVSPWSAPAWWETGLLSAQEWSAQWIGPGSGGADSAGAPAPMLRRPFTVAGAVASARIYVTARGLYELHLNGKRVGEDFFTPGWTSYHNRIQYQTYDVTRLLTSGDNVVGAILGDGWYRGYLGFSGRKNDYGRNVALLLQLEIRYRDGRVVRVNSDGDWKSATGPITYADIYRGESYDARRERLGWDAARYDANDWQPVTLAEKTTAALVAPVSEPVRETQTVRPVTMFTAPNGQVLFDLGQNITGWVRLRVSGPAGSTITLRHAEVLDKIGNLYTENLRAAYQTDRYTLKGGGEEIFEPHFTYHGFRYIAIEGLRAPPTLGMLTGVVVHTALQETGVFETSDSMLNKLQRNIVWGQRGNFLDVPTDCPQRDERLGWTGDAQVFARTAAFNMNVSGFFAKWLADLAADQHPGGSVPWVIPNPLGGDSTHFAAAAGWADASTVVPWTMYLSYGDRGVLERQFESMRKWVDYAHGRAGASLIWNRDDHFGDWLAWHSDDASYPGATTGKDFIATAYLAHSADLVARAAEVLGRTADAARYRDLFTGVRTAFRKEFVSPNGRVGENTQTAYALALNFGLLEPDEMPGAAARLVDDIRRHDGHLSTGFLGTPELTQALSANGHLDAAFALLQQKEYPGWLYPITRGATTMWERWDGIRPDGSFQEISMNSFNHYAFGAIGDWMYRTIGGLDLDPAMPGYQHALIAPRVGAGLTSARAALETGYGPLASAWHVIGSTFSLDVTIPPNTSARVTLWGTTVDRVLERGVAARGVEGVHSAVQVGRDVVLEVGSGHYLFTALVAQ
ncbi:MAG: family 78 glycoside hydrolase catalytic domain [Gemmatimonadota bacterium]